jgi:hypothetical protein
VSTRPSVTTDYPEGGDGDIPEMTVTALDRALAAGDAGRVTGERPERPDPEVPEKARRRTFTAQYKLDVVAEYDAAATGEKGAVLRREGLYSSHLARCCCSSSTGSAMWSSGCLAG